MTSFLGARLVGVQLALREMAAKQRSSSYAESLSSKAKVRYQEKISVINGVDPFCGCVREPVDVPPVDASDLVSYLVLQTNFITAKQFKAHRSLGAYNQFVCGWIKDVRTWRAAGKCVTTGRVHIYSASHNIHH